MGDYIAINREAYELTADEFVEKIELRAAATKDAIDALCGFIDARFSNPSVLELGPGSGYSLKLFSEKGYKASGIEFSQKMADVAKKTSGVEIIVDEFLAHDFGNTKFSAVFAMAFIHLFPYGDCIKVLNKMHDLLHDKGLVYVSTTLHETSGEGYCGKVNFKGQPLRFRKLFTRNELETMLSECRFRTVHKSDWQDVESPRTWMRYIVEKA